MLPSPFLPYFVVNPFFMAEAVYIDAGVLIAGAETDIGFFVILAGSDAGMILPFTEVAGGGASEIGLGVELGRIDFTGPIERYKANLLFGPRWKVWLGPSTGIFGISGAIFTSEVKGGYIIGAGIQLGVGHSTPIISGGFNYGEVK